MDQKADFISAEMNSSCNDNAKNKAGLPALVLAKLMGLEKLQGGDLAAFIKKCTPTMTFV